MLSFKDIINKELLFEAKNKTVGALKVFYDINIKIEDEEQKQEAPPVEQPIPTAPTTPVETIPQPVVPPTVPAPIDPNAPVQESVISEEEIEKKIQGEIALTKEDADNIQTVEDLIDFLGDKKHKGEPILDELTIEVITSLLGNQDAMKTSDVINKNDQIIINLVYGYKKDNSIGLKILKRRGVNSVSVIMLKDNEVLDSKFDQKRFNSQIIDYRNEWLNK